MLFEVMTCLAEGLKLVVVVVVVLALAAAASAEWYLHHCSSSLLKDNLRILLRNVQASDKKE